MRGGHCGGSGSTRLWLLCILRAGTEAGDAAVRGTAAGASGRRDCRAMTAAASDPEGFCAFRGQGQRLGRGSSEQGEAPGRRECRAVAAAAMAGAEAGDAALRGRSGVMRGAQSGGGN